MTVSARSPSPGLSRFILPIAALIAVGLCGAGILVLLDPRGGANILASIYEALGNVSGANDLRSGTGDQLIAKIILAAIALAVGVGGIWLLYLGVGGLVSALRPKWRDRILPWVLRRPCIGLAGRVPGLPSCRDLHPGFRGQQRPVHAAELCRHVPARLHQHPAQ